jgi:hypothetical protein
MCQLFNYLKDKDFINFCSRGEVVGCLGVETKSARGKPVWGLSLSLFGESVYRARFFGCLYQPIEAKASPTDICNAL